MEKKENDMDRKKMKDEAARRMKALELYDFPARSVIRAFMNDDAVFVSLPAKGNRIAELHPLTSADKIWLKILRKNMVQLHTMSSGMNLKLV